MNPGVAKPSGDLFAEVLAKQGCLCLYFVNNDGATVHDEDQIFQIVAR
jgi:hypothetical protein